MTDPFRPCGAVNKDRIPCWRCYGHRGLCEVSPFDRKDTDLPVWSKFLDYSHLLLVEGS